MSVVTNGKYQPITAFFILALLINATATFLSRQEFTFDVRHLVAYGACFDMTVIVPAIYYFLVVRRGIQTFASLFLLILICLVRAFFLFPVAIHGPFVLLGAEAGIIVLVSLRIRQGLRAAQHVPRASDPSELIEIACRAIVPVGQMAQLIASELVVFYYALFSWRSRPSRPDIETFSTHVKGGHTVLLMALACLTPIEIPIVHAALARWNKGAAWISTALGIYGLVWIIGLARSLKLKPVVVSDSGLEMNKGFLWHIRVSWSDVLAVRRLGATADTSSSGCLNLAVGGTPDFVVDLARPATAQGPFGMTKQVTAVSLSIDESQRFAECVNSKLSSNAF